MCIVGFCIMYIVWEKIGWVDCWIGYWSVFGWIIGCLVVGVVVFKIVIYECVSEGRVGESGCCG